MNKNQLVLKICCSDWKNASRDKRELSVCLDLGMRVLVLARGEEGKKDNVDGFDVIRKTSRPMGKLMPAGLNRIIALCKWAKTARKLSPDIISGHDIDGLLIGYLSTLFQKKKYRPKLVYDSHEFELGRNKPRSRAQLWFIKQLEGFLIRRCSFSIMVNDEIANIVQGLYKLENRPIVVRSTPNYWEIDEAVTRKIHDQYCEQLNVSHDSFFIMYHGGIMRDRGIEMLIKVISINPNIYGVILGNGKDEYLGQLHKLVENLHVADRIIFKSAVPIDELWKYVGAADLGMIMIPAHCENHRLSLPNKFFENIQSETPIVCPDYPAMKAIVDSYDNGITCDVSRIDSINAAVETLRLDNDLLSKKREGAKKAKKELCWEKEEVPLYQQYKKFVGGGVELLSDASKQIL